MPRASEAIVQALKESGITTIFGIPSIHNIGLYDAIRRDGSFRHIVCRHEAAATHMADGYARASGGIGVMISSTGPGAGFTLSALQEAWGSCSPVLMMTSNIDAAKIGKGLGVLHELEEQTSLFRTVTKATFSLRAGDDPYAAMKKALTLTRSNRPGPVYMEVPHDLWGTEVTVSASSQRDGQSTPLPSRIDEAVALLRRAKQPVLLIGTDAARANLATDITALAEALSAPVVGSTAAKGVLAEDHPLSFGNVARRMVVKDIVPNCDVALVIGTRLREVDAKRRGLALPEQIIHVDWDDRWIGRNFLTTVPLVGEIPAITNELRRQLEGEPYAGQRQ
jgi:acetolactate synthase-1/2/3 large subunit